jgi:serine protease Do
MEEYGNNMHKKPGGLKKIIAVCVSCLLICAITLAGPLYLAGKISLEKTENAPPSTNKTNELFPIADTNGEAMTAAQIYSKYSGSVVGIKTEGTTTNIFGQQSRFASSGTGFVVTADGYIISNNHVVEDGDKFTVAFLDGKEYDAKVIGTDAQNDIALLKINAKGLVPVVLGNSDKMEVGEDVCTIGNPLGELTFSLTKGVVSALGREIRLGDGDALKMFQLDAAVNRGNSGGPVFNSRGEVVGIITAKYSESGIEGLGFAIPINDAIKIANDLMQYGYVKGRPYFGITVSTASTGPGLDRSPVNGAKIEMIAPGSCAEKAGLKVGDIITKIDNSEIVTHLDLIDAKKNYSAGDSAELTVYRNGTTLKINITFDEQKS